MSVKHGRVAVQEKGDALEREVAALRVKLAAEQGRSAQLTEMLENACAEAQTNKAALKEAER